MAVAYGSRKLCDAAGQAWSAWLKRQADKDAELIKDRDADRQAAKDTSVALVALLQADRESGRALLTEQAAKDRALSDQTLATIASFTAEIHSHTQASKSVFQQLTDVTGRLDAQSEQIDRLIATLETLSVRLSQPVG